MLKSGLLIWIFLLKNPPTKPKLGTQRMRSVVRKAEPKRARSKGTPALADGAVMARFLGDFHGEFHGEFMVNSWNLW